MVLVFMGFGRFQVSETAIKQPQNLKLMWEMQSTGRTDPTQSIRCLQMCPRRQGRISAYPTRGTLSMAEQRTLTGDLIEKQTRRSYTQEYKLKVISFYKENKNLYRTCQRFSISTKNVLRWVKDEDKIKSSKRSSR